MTSADLPQAVDPVKLASKRALWVQNLAQEVELNPKRVSRHNRLREVMDELDAMAGLEPAPGTPELGPAGSVEFHHALAAFYRRHRRLDLTIEACRAGVEIDPQNLALREMWLRTLQSAGRLSEAAAALDLPLAGRSRYQPAALNFLQGASDLLAAGGQADLSLDVLERIAATNPRDKSLARRLLMRAESLGQEERAEVYRDRLRDLWTQRLPERLAEGLEALKQETAPIAYPPQALRWAWNQADKERWTEAEWRKALDWGTRANQMIIEWWSVRPDRAHELTQLMDAPNLDEVRAGQAAGRAQIMAGAHAGPMPAAVHLFQTSGLHFRTLGAPGAEQLAGARGTVLPVMQNRTSTSRELIEEIRRGVVLAVGADASSPDDRIEMEFMSRKVGVLGLPARLAQKYGCDSWWLQPLWRGDRIVVELERLPDPEPDEPPQQWAERWARAYLRHVKQIVRGDPRNLLLTSGVWRFANARSKVSTP